MTKDLFLLKDIILKYHPAFVKNSIMTYYALQYPKMFNIERLVEESLAAVGGYNVISKAGQDFDDVVKSDSKTVSVVNNSLTRKSYVMKIGNVDTKIGSLRVTVFNPFKNSVDYMYIPNSDLSSLKEADGTRRRASGIKERIRATWSEGSDSYNKLNRYRVGTFKELAQAMY